MFSKLELNYISSAFEENVTQRQSRKMLIRTYMQLHMRIVIHVYLSKRIYIHTYVRIHLNTNIINYVYTSKLSGLCYMPLIVLMVA